MLLSTAFCLNFLWIQLHFIIQMRKMFPISLSENVLLFASTLKFMVVQGCDCNKLFLFSLAVGWLARHF